MKKLILFTFIVLMSFSILGQSLDTPFGVQGIRDLLAQQISYYTKSPIGINENGNILMANYFTGASCLDSNGNFVPTFSYSEIDGNTTVIKRYPGNKYITGTNFQGIGAFVKRLHENGTIDTSFATMGMIQTNGDVHDIIINADSTIIVVCNPVALWYGVKVIKLLSNGTIDSSFGTNGNTISYQFNYLQNFNLTSGNIHLVASAKDNNNNYYIGGMDSNNARIIKLLPNGMLDTSFHFLYDIGFEDEVRKILIYNNNFYAVCGKFNASLFNCMDSEQDTWSILKFTSTGSLDSSYGINGMFIDNSIRGPLANAFIDINGITLIGADQNANSAHIIKGIKINPNATIEPQWHIEKSLGACTTITGAEKQNDGKIVISSAYESPVAIYGCSAIRYNDTFYCSQNNSPNPIIVFNGTNLTCTNVTNIQFYEWTFNNAIISTASSLIPTQNGIYIVKAIDSNGCFGLDTLNYISVGINNAFNPELNWDFYPNPASNEIIIKHFNSTSTDQTINIYNLVGTLVYSTKINSKHQNFKIDLNHIPSGVYYISFNNSTRKLIKN